MEKREDQITIDAQGRWWYEGSEIIHPEVLALFRSSLRETEDGAFEIDYRGRQAPVVVEKTPFFIREIKAVEESGKLLAITLMLDDGSDEELIPESLRLDEDGVLMTKVKKGLFSARCLPKAHFRLAALLDEDENGFFLSLGGRIFRLPAGA